jgi:hypothetical protein
MMVRVAKIVLAVSAAVALAYGQASDSSAKQLSTAPVVKQSTAASTVAPTISSSKYFTGVVKPKVPTNWSKIKDLFL